MDRKSIGFTDSEGAAIADVLGDEHERELLRSLVEQRIWKTAIAANMAAVEVDNLSGVVRALVHLGLAELRERVVDKGYETVGNFLREAVSPDMADALTRESAYAISHALEPSAQLA